MKTRPTALVTAILLLICVDHFKIIPAFSIFRTQKMQNYQVFLGNSKKWSSFKVARTKNTIMQLEVMESASLALYDAQNWASHVVEKELLHITPLSLGVLYLGGLLTSFSPCVMSMLPLTISYIGGLEAFDSKMEGSEQRGNLLLSSSLFALGLASALTVLGVAATYVGKVYGQVAGPADFILPSIASLISVAGGLVLLDVVPLNIPTLETGNFANLPKPLRTFMLGATSALISSPCSTPVLGSILGFLAASKNPILGVALLLSYTCGYTTPIFLAGAASGSLTRSLSTEGLAWVTPLMGSVFIFYGVYSILSIISPITGL